MAFFLDNDVSPARIGVSALDLPEIAEVYARFDALVTLANTRFGGELGGRLLLYGQLDARGAAMALAANIVGAATLGVDADRERLRQGIRRGFCDFVVNHLDEALRILKNEVRKKQPVSVCLEGDLVATLGEAVERGLQPDLLAFAENSGAVGTLMERGAVSFDRVLPEPEAEHEEVTWIADSAAALWMPKVDALAAQVIPVGDGRARWLKFAPRYLGRAMGGTHYLRMAAEEAERFAALVAETAASGAIGSRIRIERRVLGDLPRPR